MKYSLIILSFLFSLSAKAQQWERAMAFNYTPKYSNFRHVNDRAGNIYITGEIAENQPLDLDGNILSSKGNLDIFITKLDSNFSVIWAKSFGSLGEESVTGIAMDYEGNLLMSGYFSLSMVMGMDTLKSLGSSDFFICKLDSMGNVNWAKSGGSKFQDYSYTRTGGVYTDTNNNIYVAGMFANEFYLDTLRTAWFDTLSVKSFGGQDVFMAKYSANGRIIWLKNMGSHFDDFGELYLKGNFLYVCGSSEWQFHYDSLILKNPSGEDIGFIIKMDLSGNVLWANGAFLKDVGTMYIGTITTDSFDNVYVVGLYYCLENGFPLTFDNFYLAEIGGTDIFIAKLDKNGKVKWLKRAGGYANDGPNKIITKNNNYFIITGGINGGGFYEGKTIQTTSGVNTFILEIDNNGKPMNFEFCGNTGDNKGNDLSITKDGKLLVTGDNRGGTLTFDSITMPLTDKPSSFFIARRNFIPKPLIGIREIKKISIKIFPNPADETISIQLPEYKKGLYSVKIFAFDGKLVEEIIINERYLINTYEWKSGLYLFVIRDELMSVVETHKISIIH